MSSGPSPASSPQPLSRADTIYTALLGVLAFFQLLGALTYLWMAHLPDLQKSAILIMYVGLTINAAYLAFELLVLIIRVRAPAKRKWPTFALNIVLLLVLPFGTALGIWGLLKVT